MLNKEREKTNPILVDVEYKLHFWEKFVLTKYGTKKEDLISKGKS